MAIQQGHYGNYTGNARCCGSSGPLKEKDSTIHKHYMENAVNDLEKGDTRAGKYEASRAAAFKNIGMHLKGATASAAPKAYGEVMHGSMAGALKNVLGPDNPHDHNKITGKVEGKNAMKMKNDDDGGGILASDPGAAGRELLYNQSKASGLKKTGEEEFKAGRAKDNEETRANDENSARKLSLASSAVKAKKCHHNLK